ncbi:LPS O-antigen subunit length determinant protein (WzzB/FepE family) [Vibrio crassostreae]|uniref:LPS O-antigen chain length determinant protein WzzB n=1 Tax=Vibrio crassostreae TaxID=246167 RepID=UPI000F4ACCEF|nr:Wzz/FepE/Etk N-terminal domain-containing protein [Vibrio crassostreae]ROO66117.1 LPS O-antigen subunit length determinant protein (WzzB/FepE family) [Vibrio crassostreae]ROP03195.1 LPS O-antigen subunit length determinant protein (WzzB/FepE family) [Vibrio crassostreae]ROQ72038.1 LPS O-antigen subunit length determinant protein (WzzB/FepE family) [Vibrio crassostreae]ROR77647.1 LPS O-antigen subunit length determinant protein (WzzB/FepE family) [Vibrio crassostreae]ROS65597.1 LPS O-antigen
MKQQNQPQSYSPGSPPINTSGSEMSLRELFKVLWDGKLVIILATVLFTASGISFALLTQEWWSSQATVTEAQPQDLAAYQQQVKQFQPAFDIYQDDGTVLVGKGLDRLADSKLLFQRFINTFNSTNNKRAFLNSSVEFQEFKSSMLTSGSDITADEIRALYAKWFNRVSASIADTKDRHSPYVVSFQATTKESSFDLLTAYILATELKVHEDAFNNLQATVNGKRNELVQQKIILESQAANQLLVETERAKYAAQIATSAGVDKPIQIGNDKEIFSIDLGAKGLEAKVQALNSVKNLSVIEPRLQQIDAKLDMLRNLEVNRDVDFKTFRFLENVEQPITRDKPKRAMIALISTLFGAVFGVAIVIVRFAFRKED